MSIKEHPPQSDSSKDDERLHVPVLLDAVTRLLNPKQGESYLDLTAGYGGHANAILEKTVSSDTSVLVDRDEFAIQQLGRFKEQGVYVEQSDFLSAAERFVTAGRVFDIVFADLGVSSPQLDKAERGFSFSHSGPLDMRMDRSQELTAEFVVNTYSLQNLVDIIVKYGEETPRQADRIARAIRSNRPFQTTGQLAEVIKQISRSGRIKIHPATRTFQALRIEVNQELSQLEALLPLLPRLLKPGGRVGVISFHSLEDRLVKHYFKEQDQSGYESQLRLVTKHPVRGATTDAHNPRARSATLRVAVKK